MGSNVKRICSICARGGSKGVKGKNTRVLFGKPLIAHTIIQAKESTLFDYIAVSSDSEEILSIAKEYGVQFCIKRPDELANDKAAKVPAIRHCVEEVERLSGVSFDTCVDLDCTSPLRNVDDIKNAVTQLEESKCENIITGTPSRRSPYFNIIEINSNGNVELSKTLGTQIVRRQDVPKTYDMNASIYVWQRDALQKNNKLFLKSTQLYEMPEERSIDIDSEQDYEYVSFLMGKRDEFKR